MQINYPHLGYSVVLGNKITVRVSYNHETPWRSLMHLFGKKYKDTIIELSANDKFNQKWNFKTSKFTNDGGPMVIEEEEIAKWTEFFRRYRVEG